jgi:hypothetical protein
MAKADGVYELSPQILRPTLERRRRAVIESSAGSAQGLCRRHARLRYGPLTQENGAQIRGDEVSGSMIALGSWYYTGHYRPYERMGDD